MAFDDYEYSVSNSQPDELYEFTYEGDGSTYRITSSAYEIDFLGGNYQPESVSRSDIQQTSEVGKNGLTVKVGRYNSYFTRHLIGSLTYRTTLTVYTIQPDLSYIAAWSGTVKTVTRTTDNIEVFLSPISTSSVRPILHRKYQAQCPHKLFSYYCAASDSSFTYSGIIDSMDGTEIVSSTFSLYEDGWFTGGEITVGSEIKTIVSHSGSNIQTLDSFYDVSDGDSFSVKAGCDHSIDTCREKFSNELNFGGCPFIPTDDDLTTGKSFDY